MWDAYDGVPAAERQWIVGHCCALGDRHREEIKGLAAVLDKQDPMAVATYASALGRFDPETLAREELGRIVDGRKLAEAAHRRRTPVYLRLWWQVIIGVAAIIGGTYACVELIKAISRLFRDRPPGGP